MSAPLGDPSNPLGAKRSHLHLREHKQHDEHEHIIRIENKETTFCANDMDGQKKENKHKIIEKQGRRCMENRVVLEPCSGQWPGFKGTPGCTVSNATGLRLRNRFYAYSKHLQDQLNKLNKSEFDWILKRAAKLQTSTLRLLRLMFKKNRTSELSHIPTVFETFQKRYELFTRVAIFCGGPIIRSHKDI